MSEPDVIAEIRAAWTHDPTSTHTDQCHPYHPSCAIALLLDRITPPDDIDVAAMVGVLRATAAERREVQWLCRDAADLIEHAYISGVGHTG